MLKAESGGDSELMHALLHAYHKMIEIMTYTCLHPWDEMVYDNHINSFVHMLGHIKRLFDLQAHKLSDASLLGSFDMPQSIVDLGCIWPLYFVVGSDSLPKIV